MATTHRKIELVDGTAALGKVGTNTVASQNFLPTQAGVYNAEDSIGGLVTFPGVTRTGILSGYLIDALVADKTDSRFQALLVLFSEIPTSSTITDKTTVVLHPADIGKVIRVLSITPGEWATVVGVGFADIEVARSYISVDTNIHGALILDQANLTLTGPSDIVVTFGIAYD